MRKIKIASVIILITSLFSLFFMRHSKLPESVIVTVEQPIIVTQEELPKLEPLIKPAEIPAIKPDVAPLAPPDAETVPAVIPKQIEPIKLPEKKIVEKKKESVINKKKKKKNKKRLHRTTTHDIIMQNIQRSLGNFYEN